MLEDMAVEHVRVHRISVVVKTLDDAYGFERAYQHHVLPAELVRGRRRTVPRQDLERIAVHVERVGLAVGVRDFPDLGRAKPDARVDGGCPGQC